MSHRFTIGALEELIAARRDAEQGLRTCAEHVRGQRLRELLWSHLQECTEALQELQSLVHCWVRTRKPSARGSRPSPIGARRSCAQLLLVTRMRLFSMSVSVAKAERSRST